MAQQIDAATESLIVKFDDAGLSRGEAEAYVLRQVKGHSRQRAADTLEKAPSTVDTLFQRAKNKIDTMQESLEDAGRQLPRINRINQNARVGNRELPAVEIWFANDSALRYAYDEEQGEIREQTYLNGVVHDDLGVDGGPDQLAEYALESVGEYLQTYQHDPEACKQDWPHIYDMLVAEAR